jgi:hypothetical protein
MSTEELNKEIWLPVVDYEDLYQVSNCGRIRRIYKRGKWPALGIMRTTPNSDGYPSLNLRDHYGSRKHLTVHLTVIIAFKGYPEEGDQCRHMDGNKNNCHISNLEWGTVRENQEDKIRHGSLKGSKNPNAKLNQELVNEIRIKLSGFYSYRTIQKEYGISRAQVWRIKSYTSWSEEQ